MSTRVLGSLLLLIAVVFLLNVGEFAAQDPQPATPAPAQTAQVDLSGTYTGTFDCEPAGLMGESTLTITGNQFTTADGKTGRIVALPGGSVAFQVGEMTPASTTGATAAAPAAPKIFSLRARKQGTRLTLTSAPGTNVKCSFTTGRMARGRKTRTPAATGTEVANPATVPAPTTTPPPEAPIPAQTPAPSPTPMPSPTVNPTPEPSPEPQPSPEPSPGPSPAPTPVPSPNPSPTPSPSPTASPTPSPTPSPRRG